MSRGLLIGGGIFLAGVWYAARKDAARLKTGETKKMTDPVLEAVKQLAAEKNPEKKAEMKKQLDAEVAKRKVAEEAEAKKPKPFYPVGLQVQFGKITAVITEARQDAKGAWQYTTQISGTPFGIKDGAYPSDEGQLRGQLAEQTGQPLAAGQAFPAGIAVYRGGQGGMLQKAEKNAAGEWVYTVQGWPNTVTQEQLLGILRK